MVSPLTFTDLYGVEHIEPSVTGRMQVQTVESVYGTLVNDLIIVSPFRSGQPQTLRKFSNLGALADVHDPDGNADEGVALATIARSGFAEDDIYGAASLYTVRVDNATQGSVSMLTGSTTIATVVANDYGTQSNKRRLKVEAATTAGKKLTLLDLENSRRTYTKDNLGQLLSGLQYTGNATIAHIAVRSSVGLITYTATLPSDGDMVRVTTGGVTKVYEFDSNSTIVAGNVAVTIAATADLTWEAFRAAVETNADQLDSATISTTGNTVTITATRGGVLVEELVDAAAVYVITHPGVGARLIGEIGASIAYTGVPTDADTIVVQGSTFEFDGNSSVAAGNIAVTIGTEDVSYANLVDAINKNLYAQVWAYHVAGGNLVYVVSNSVQLSTITATITGPSTAVVTDEQTDTSYGFNLELLGNNWKTLQLLAGAVNNQTGWTCSVSQYANKVLDSTGLDVLAHTDVKTAVLTHTGYVAAIVDWINHNTKSQYTATEVARGEPTVATYQFAGGTTPTVTAANWTSALDVIATGVEEGGILLVNSDDATVMASVVSWIDEQRSAGKWFRAYFGLPEAYTVTQYADLAGAIDHSGVRLTCQRIGVYKSDNSIEYLHPVYLAAMLAGGASGNNPWVPLTNKRVRIADVHASDRYSLVDRETLIVSGITVLKEEIQQWYVDLNVTTSRDPDKRMVRLVSEIDTANLVDARMRRAFLQFRGKWASGSIGARVTLVKRRVLDPFVTDGALVPGIDAYGNDVPAWRDKAIGPNGESWIIEEGVLKLGYSIYMAGELNHVSLDGNAEYVKLVGSVSGREADMVTTVPTR